MFSHKGRMYLLIFTNTYYVFYSDDTTKDHQKVKELHRKSGVKGIIHTFNVEKKIIRAEGNRNGKGLNGNKR